MKKVPTCFSIILLLSSCVGNKQDALDDMPSLYPAPQSVALNIVEGYTINSLTGDSIFPLVNSKGDIIETGVPVPVSGRIIPPDSLARLVTLPPGKPEIIDIKLNVHQISKSPTIIPVNKDSLVTSTPGVDTSSVELLNSTGDTLLTGVQIPVQGKVVPFIRPLPIQALPSRFKDNAVYNIQYLDVGQGMNTSNIISILEDSKGNIWFGTFGAGVSMYDGETFTHITKKQGLSSNNVMSMVEDRQGNIWFGTWGGGVNMYDGNALIHFTENEGLSNNQVMSIFEDSQGCIWFGTMGGGVCMFNGQSFTHFTKKEGLSDNSVWTILEDRQGNLWFGTQDGGVNLYNGKTFTHFTEAEGLLGNDVHAILEDHQGNLWFSSVFGVSMYNGKTFTQYTEVEGLSNQYVGMMLEDSDGNLWFGTWGGGANMFDGKTMTHFTENEGLSSDFIQSMLEDSHGNLWFGTRDGGVSIYKREAFTNLSEKEGLAHNLVLSAEEDSQGNLWFGTGGGGVCRYNGETFAHFTYKEGIGNNMVVSILKDSQDNLWFGTDGMGATKYDGESFTYFMEEFGLSNNHIWSMLEDRHGNLWFGTMGGGVSMFDGEKITHFTEKEGMSNNSVWSILEDSHGNIWFGTDGGVSIFNGETFTYLTEKEGLSSDQVSSILEDRDGNIWISTSHGLNQVSIDSEFDSYNIHHISSFGLQDGLKGMVFSKHSAFLDSENRIWWGNDKCLAMLNMNNYKISAEPLTTRLNNLEINEKFVDYRHLKDGDPLAMEFDDVARFLNYPVNLELPYNQNHLTFHFSSIDWSAPHKIRYSFKMEGLPGNWSIPSAESKADFRNLSHGTYTFKVCAIGGSQTWSKPFEYTFTILPPFWLTWWAYLIYFSALIFIFLWTRRFELNRARLKAELKTERIQKEKIRDLERMKTRFFTNISHEFRTPLTLILGPLEDVLRKDRANIGLDRSVFVMMKRNAKRLQRLINQLLDISRLESGKMNIIVAEGDLTGFVRTLASAFISLAESKKIEYIIQLPDKGIKCVFDHDKFEKIINNLLSNAFKYTSREGTVRLELIFHGREDYSNPHFALIKVQDTGRGIEKDQLAKIFDRFSVMETADNREDDSVGIGLALTKELVDLLKGTIEVKSEAGKGTEFMVTLPVSEEFYAQEKIVELAGEKEERVTEIAYAPEPRNEHSGDMWAGLKDSNDTEILVVEDNDDLRSYICSKLESEYTVFNSVNGKEGLCLIQERIPDLVISDLIMPEMGGLELCRAIKNDLRTSHIPVIILTAKSDKPSKLEGLATGADDYISKPFDAEELQIRVKNLITQRERLKELFRKELLGHELPAGKKGHGDQLIKRLLETFEKKYSEYDFSVDDMGKEMLMSRAQFYRKVNALTGTSPNELLRVFRIRKAASLLESDGHNIAEVMYEVGFRSTSHFAESFRKYYGKNPSEYRDSLLFGK